MIDVLTALFHAAGVHLHTFATWLTASWHGWGDLTDKSFAFWSTDSSRWFDLLIAQFRSVLGVIGWVLVLVGLLFVAIGKFSEKEVGFAPMLTALLSVVGIIAAFTFLPAFLPFLLLLAGFIFLAMPKSVFGKVAMLAFIVSLGVCSLGGNVMTYAPIAILALPILWWKPGFWTTSLVVTATIIALTTTGISLPALLIAAFTVYAYLWLPKAKKA